MVMDRLGVHEIENGEKGPGVETQCLFIVLWQRIFGHFPPNFPTGSMCFRTRFDPRRLRHPAKVCVAHPLAWGYHPPVHLDDHPADVTCGFKHRTR